MADHEWTTITVGGEAWEVSRDAVKVDGLRVTATYHEAQDWAERLGGELPTPAILDARWQQADLRNRPHTQRLWEGENDAAAHSRAIDADIAAYGTRPRIVGNCGKHWVACKSGTGWPLYGWHVDTPGRSWRGIPLHPADSAETLAKVIQPYSPHAHPGGTHKDYSMTVVLCRRPAGSVGGAIAGAAGGAIGGAAGAAMARAAADVADTIPGPPPSIPELRPLSTAERKATFGRIRYERAPTAADPEAIRILDGWAGRHLERVVIPQLASIPGIVHRGRTVGRGPKSGAVMCHSLIAGQLRDLWQAWEDAWLLDRVLAWAGLWCPRLMRGGTSLSSHAWGTAFDINAPWNGLNHEPAAVGQRGSVRELVPIARDFGFVWGGDFSARPDGMHFEAAEVIGEP